MGRAADERAAGEGNGEVNADLSPIDPMYRVDAGVMQASLGALEAQRVIAGIQAGALTPDHAWLCFVELAAAHGWKSAGCRACVVELAKRLQSRA